MKKLIPVALIAVLSLMLALSGCINDGPPGPSGPIGPRGPEGPQGVPGESGFVFEWEGVFFEEFNEDETELQVIIPWDDNFEVLTSDVALIYLLWDSYETNDGEIVEIWRQLPQLVTTPYGMINYTFDFTIYDFRLILQPNYDFGLLEGVDTDDWVVRAVIVPGNFVNNGRVDFSDYNAVKEALGLPELDHPGHTPTRRN